LFDNSSIDSDDEEISQIKPVKSQPAVPKSKLDKSEAMFGEEEEVDKQDENQDEDKDNAIASKQKDQPLDFAAELSRKLALKNSNTTSSPKSESNEENTTQKNTAPISATKPKKENNQQTTNTTLNAKKEKNLFDSDAENDSSDELFAPKSKTDSLKKQNLFDKDEDDDSTKVIPNAPSKSIIPPPIHTSVKDSYIEGWSDDEEKEETTIVKKEMPKSVLADELNRVFAGKTKKIDEPSEPVTRPPPSQIEIKPKLEDAIQKPSIEKKKISIFDDEEEESDDLFGSSKPIITQQQASKTTTSLNSKSAAKKISLFDDDEENDPLFSSKPATTAPPKPVIAEPPKNKLTDILSQEPKLDPLSVLTSSATAAVPNKENTLTKTEPKSKFSNIFDDDEEDDNLFNKPVQSLSLIPTSKNVPEPMLKNNTSKKSLFDDEENEDDLFTLSKTIQNKPVLPQPLPKAAEEPKLNANIVKSVMVSKPAPASLFDDDEEADLFSSMSKPVSVKDKPPAQKTVNLFGEDEETDLFSSNLKSNYNNNKNSDKAESISAITSISKPESSNEEKIVKPVQAESAKSIPFIKSFVITSSFGPRFN
jgi:hypothetical protein